MKKNEENNEWLLSYSLSSFPETEHTSELVLIWLPLLSSTSLTCIHCEGGTIMSESNHRTKAYNLKHYMKTEYYPIDIILWAPPHSEPLRTAEELLKHITLSI